MPQSLPAGFTSAIRKIQQPQPWLWLWRLTQKISTSASVYADVVNFDEPVTWGGMTFRPWPMEQSEIETSGDGNLPTMTLTLDNTTRVLSPYVMAEKGFIGQNAYAWLVNKQNLGASPLEYLTITWQIASIVVTKSITLQLELPNLNEIEVPQFRYNIRNCRFVFGKLPCPYIINSSAAYTTCNKTVSDCTLRGDNMVNRGHPRQLPQMFGGFPGVPVNG